MRPCLDPRPLNAALIRPYRQTSKVQEMVDGVNDHKIFTVLDFKHAFWHVLLDEESRQLCSFATPKGVYKFNRLPFGLSVSTEIFQREASKIFQNIPNVRVYIDDLLISAKTEKEHDQTLLEVIKTARENNVKFNAKKIQFRTLSVIYVGYQLNGDGRAITLSREDAIKEIPLPENTQALQSFLGQLCKRVRSRANMTSQSQDLLKKDAKYWWSKFKRTRLDRDSLAALCRLESRLSMHHVRYLIQKRVII